MGLCLQKAAWSTARRVVGSHPLKAPHKNHDFGAGFLEASPDLFLFRLILHPQLYLR